MIRADLSALSPYAQLAQFRYTPDSAALSDQAVLRHAEDAEVCALWDAALQAQEAVLLDWQNQSLEEFAQPFAINGYEYEAQEAMACVSQGRLTSSLVPMEETIRVIRLLEECRRQWR